MEEVLKTGRGVYLEEVGTGVSEVFNHQVDDWVLFQVDGSLL